MYSVAGTTVKVYSEEEKQSGAHAGRWTWTSAPGRNALVMFLPGHTAACRAQNCNLESFSLTTLSSISLLLVRQHAGEVNVSLFAVGLCCRHAAKAVADRRQSLPPPTTAGPAAPPAAAAPHGFGSAFLDPGVSVVRQLANLAAHRKTRNRAALAPAGVAELLASAFKPGRQDGPPPNCARTAHPDPADEHGEPSLGPAQDPGGVGAAGVQSLRENDSQVYASNPPSRAVFPLAVVPEAAWVGHLGARLLLCPDHNV